MTTDRQPLNLDQIETVATAATPGPWTAWAESYPHLVLQGPKDVHPSEAEGVISTNLAVNEAADAAYIAAMPPETARALVVEIRRLRDQLATATEFRLTPAPPAYTPLIVRRDRAYDGTRWAVLHDPSDLSVRRAWTADGWEMAWSLRHAEIFCWPDAETALAQAQQAQAEGDREPDVDGVGRTPESYRDRPAVVPAAGGAGE